MRELFTKFEPEFCDAPIAKEVQFAYQLMVWMSNKKRFLSPRDTISNLMAAVTLRMEMMPHVYQLGLQSNATIETAIPIYSQQNKGITAHTILVPAYFDKIFNLPFRMHQALNGLVTATSQMRYDGSCQFVEYHRAAFLQSVH